MRITFGSSKYNKALTERGLDFADAALIFAGVTLEVEDTRKDYGETRVIPFLDRNTANSPLPLQGEGWDGDGVITLPHAFTPIPTLTLPLKGRELLAFLPKGYENPCGVSGNGIICYGMLVGRMVVVGYTPRGADRHVFIHSDISLLRE